MSQGLAEIVGTGSVFLAEKMRMGSEAVNDTLTEKQPSFFDCETNIYTRHGGYAIFGATRDATVIRDVTSVERRTWQCVFCFSERRKLRRPVRFQVNKKSLIRLEKVDASIE